MGCGMRVRLLGRTMLGFGLSGGKCLVCGLVSYWSGVRFRGIVLDQGIVRDIRMLIQNVIFRVMQLSIDQRRYKAISIYKNCF